MSPTRSVVRAAIAASLATLTLSASGAVAAPGALTGRDIREIPQGKTYRLDPSIQASMPRAALRAAAPLAAEAIASPPVGTVRGWIALDDEQGALYRKEYTLRGVGQHIEVWVASGSDATSSGIAFPTGDCRNTVPGSVEITDAQVQSLVDQFDNNMYPKESAAFSVPPSRDGTNALISGDFTGPGDKIVTLVDNVRDDNFYDFPARPTYIAGFFSSAFDDLLDRNVMTIDAFDWLHRTGANPPDEPNADLCLSRPARPHLYEGVFAHEYQHLLMSYTDASEVNFINEGLSDHAAWITGYSNSTASVFEPGAESHLYCFNGFGTIQTAYNPNPRDCGGPQNSLTLWGDEGSGNEILADYGNAWSFMQFLHDRYGPTFMTALHNDPAKQGIPAIQAQLDAFAAGTKVYDVLHDFQVMNLVDGIVDSRRGKVRGTSKARVTTPSLESVLNLDNPRSYAIPGAAPNGADYVRLRDTGGKVLSGKRLKSLSFTGATTLPPLPLRWTVVNDAPGRTGNPTLWSGNESNLDASAVLSVTVPAANPTLTYVENHFAENTFDYAYTVVSTDGGKTYTPLANANTVDGPFGPALNSPADPNAPREFVTQTFDLSAYAGQQILLGFRYVSDGGVNEGGWYVDDVAVGGTVLSDGATLNGIRSPTQISPIQVANWSVKIVGIDERHRSVLVRSFNGRSRVTLSRRDIAHLRRYPVLVAVVAYDDPTEQVQQFAPYTLVVNGVVQPGG